MNIDAITGQVSGIAAHIAKESNCRTSRIDVDKLRKEAREEGVMVDK